MPKDKDDDEVSSLGGQDSIGNHSIEDEIENIQDDNGGLDADEAAELRRRNNAEEYCLEINGFRCPDDYINVLTPMEFEELVSMFQEYDVDGSRTIDRHEARKILLNLGVDSSLEDADKMLALVDTEKTGEINFEQFCTFFIMLKRGDERMAMYADLMNAVKNTALGALEHQCEMRELKMTFITVEERPSTELSPAMFVMELHLTGVWYELKAGHLEGIYQTKIFQGIGQSTRLAKDACAATAAMKLQSFMPGVKYKDGEFPDEWIKWTDENLARGVSPYTVLSILTAKGFHPYRNLGLMHRVISWRLFDIFLEENPEFDIGDANSLDIRFQQWVKDCVSVGLEGEIMFKMLQDRCIDIMNEFIWFSQKLRNNELPGSTLMGRDGIPPMLMDFHEACRLGQLEIVKLYMECNQPVNEEKLGRHSSEALTGLMLAAKSNHWEIAKLLCERNADVNHIDRRGRAALHYAALAGATETCDVLMSHGGKLFLGDHRGNNSLHFAALNNHPETIDFLAYKGQEFCRAVCSDKIRVIKGQTFEGLTEQVFEEMQEKKLTAADTLRFEKCWMNESTFAFTGHLDKDVVHMLAPSCQGITDDIMIRFDPRPETGCYVLKAFGVDNEQVFVPTIPSAHELGVILKYIFKQSALDTTNYLGKSALHVACEANKTNSHEKVIEILIDTHGCNVLLEDVYKRTPMQYLMADKEFANCPTGTVVREEILYEQRAVELANISKVYFEKARVATEQRRQVVLADCIKRATELSFSVWDATKTASFMKAIYGFEGTEMGEWEYYEDPDTLNNFYCKKPVDLSESDHYTDFDWGIPEAVRSTVNKQAAFAFYIPNRCTLIRKIGRWAMYVCKRTKCNIFVDHMKEEVMYTIPKECRFRQIVKFSESVRKLGFGNEWEEMLDTVNGHTFYRNSQTRECCWDRPYEAVEITPSERFCTGFTYKDKATDQKFFTCEQCNTDIKNAGGPSNVMVKLCEPCVFRCHKGHKGIRLVRKAIVNCSCQNHSSILNCECNARVVSANQLEKQRRSLDHRGEVRRMREHNALMPLVFAPVPRYLPDGTPKLESGWMLCRRPPPKGLDVMGAVGGDDSPRKGFSRLLPPQSPESQDSPDKNILAAGGSTMLDGMGSVATSDTQATYTGSLFENVTLSDSYLQSLQETDEFPYEPPIGLPPGWIEVCDVTEPDRYKIGARVLVECFYGYTEFGPPKVYGNVLATTSVKDIYWVKYDTDNNDYRVHRDRMELISRDTFFCNPETGESAWTIDDANDDPQPSTTLVLTAHDWLHVYEGALPRRSFEHLNPPMEELIEPCSKAKMWVNLQIEEEERYAVRLQSLYRQKHQKPRPRHWVSKAFSFDKPKEIYDYERTLAGWAYLRRRSSNIGEFKDIYTAEWEEYVDSETAEFFYWQEDTNMYQWEKPETPKHIDPNSRNKELYMIGDKVVYKFDGFHSDEPAIVTRVRFDDQTGEDMYDLEHQFKPVHNKKWVARKYFKTAPKEGEELMLMRYEKQWKTQIRRRKEAELREAKRARIVKIAADIEKARLREQLAPKGRFAALTGAGKGEFADKAKARVYRTQRERQDVLEEIDRVAGELRRERAKVLLEEAKAANPHKLTRSDVLCMQRAIDMKLKFEDKIRDRDLIQAELARKKKEAKKRVIATENYLRDKESNMTTPRTLVRRRLCRKMHSAMQRQSDCFVICEWGCGDWIRAGQEQIDHQQKRCTKRILPCSLDCTLKLSEEDWLRPHTVLTEEEKEIIKASKTHNDANDVLNMEGVTYRQFHETEMCPKRLVNCPRQCLEWVCAEVLDEHLNDLCTKRPAKPVYCRLGTCGKEFGNCTIEGIIQAEEDRIEHEQEECIFRLVRCNWVFEDGTLCASQMEARSRDAHRDYHLSILGTRTYLVAGTYVYKVPHGLSRVKVQMWGAGGGSGVFKGRRCGNGGGGAFVEAILEVDPYDVLEIVVGTGGQAGVFGTNIECVDIDEQRRQTQIKRRAEMYKRTTKKEEKEKKKKAKDLTMKDLLAIEAKNIGADMKEKEKAKQEAALGLQVAKKENKDDDDNDEGFEEDNEEDENKSESSNGDFKDESTNIQFDVIDSESGASVGGQPGGGIGYGGGGLWAGGGGGGYTIIAKRSAKGNQALLVAAGGGGGSSQHGLPGMGMDGPPEGTRIDRVNGGTATALKGGDAGDSGNIYNSDWPAAEGEMWTGGYASQYGGGGGGGYFGGGGGGTLPGIGGGGGGGSSYVHIDRVFDYTIVGGDGYNPGGLQHNPPHAVGAGEWDLVGGLAGQGARTIVDKNNSTIVTTCNGNSGAVRIIKPGFY